MKVEFHIGSNVGYTNDDDICVSGLVVVDEDGVYHIAHQENINEI